MRTSIGKNIYGEEPSQSVFTCFENEFQRLYNTLDNQLTLQAQKGSQWITLDRPSIADFAFHTWVRIAFTGEQDISQYTHVVKWRDALAADKEVERAQSKQSSIVVAVN